MSRTSETEDDHRVFAQYAGQLGDALASSPESAYALFERARTIWRDVVIYRTAIVLGTGSIKVSVQPTAQLRLAEVAEVYLGSARTPQRLLGRAIYRAILARQRPAQWWGSTRYEQLVALWAKYPPQNAETAKLRSAIRAAFLGEN